MQIENISFEFSRSSNDKLLTEFKFRNLKYLYYIFSQNVLEILLLLGPLASFGIWSFGIQLCKLINIYKNWWHYLDSIKVSMFLLQGRLERSKRGASVYRMYIPSSGGQNTYLLNLNDPAPFIQYLGGQSSGTSSSTKGGGSTGAFGTSLLKSYNQHTASQPSIGASGSSGSPSSAGWQPAGSSSSGSSSSHTPSFSSGGRGDSAGSASG